MLADDVYWLFHDEGSGRPRVPTRTAGTVVAAGLLAELSAAGFLHVDADSVHPAPATGARPGRPDAARPDHVAPDPAEPDPAGAEVLARVLAEPGAHPLRAWLAVLAHDAPHLVGERMTRAGTAVRRTLRRSLARRLRREHTYLPTDPIAAAWPAARLTTGVRRHHRFAPADAFLLGLVAATPLAADLLADSTPDMRRHALDQVEDLPRTWQDLIGTTRVAVAAGVLTNRT